MATVERKEYSVRCHCGSVKGNFFCDKNLVFAWNCNCSDCSMRGNVHIVVSEQDFSLDLDDGKTLEDLTILYEWGTKVAKRRFCKTCGILPWYTPRSNPDGVALTLKCIDWGSGEKPTVEMKFFDGIHWEESFAACKISEESQPKS
jgi:hypothetical protein